MYGAVKDELAATLTEIEEAGLVENAARRGEEIRAAISGLESPLIAEVRGRGLLIGVGLHHDDGGRIAAAALGEGLIINAPNARSLRIAPPLIVGDAEVRDFVLGQDLAKKFIGHAEQLLRTAVEGYLLEGRRYVTVAVGCTGGKHRSVAIAEAVAERLRSDRIDTFLVHRDLGRE